MLLLLHHHTVKLQFRGSASSFDKSGHSFGNAATLSCGVFFTDVKRREAPGSIRKCGFEFERIEHRIKEYKKGVCFGYSH